MGTYGADENKRAEAAPVIKRALKEYLTQLFIGRQGRRLTSMAAMKELFLGILDSATTIPSTEDVVGFRRKLLDLFDDQPATQIPAHTESIVGIATSASQSPTTAAAALTETRTNVSPTQALVELTRTSGSNIDPRRDPRRPEYQQAQKSSTEESKGAMKSATPVYHVAHVGGLTVAPMLDTEREEGEQASEVEEEAGQESHVTKIVESESIIEAEKPSKEEVLFEERECIVPATIQGTSEADQVDRGVQQEEDMGTLSVASLINEIVQSNTPNEVANVQTPEPQLSRTQLPTAVPTPDGPSNKNITCWYWHNKRPECCFAEAECIYAHKITPWVQCRLGGKPTRLLTARAPDTSILGAASNGAVLQPTIKLEDKETLTTTKDVAKDMRGIAQKPHKLTPSTTNHIDRQNQLHSTSNVNDINILGVAGQYRKDNQSTTPIMDLFWGATNLIRAQDQKELFQTIATNLCDRMLDGVSILLPRESRHSARLFT